MHVFASRYLWLLLGSMMLSTNVYAQSYLGLRFASNVNYFPRAEEFDLVGGAFTTGLFGISYSNYQPASGFSVGLNVNYKDGNGKGFPSLPVVMQDYGAAAQNVGHTSIEMELKVGPKVGILYPQIGYILGYRFTQTGFLQDNGSGREVNPIYLMLPFGATTNLPTGFGTVGFGAFFNVGVLNVLRPEQPASNNGGRQRFINLEITVAYKTKD